MSTLIVDELYPGVVAPQPFTITRDLNAAVIRLWIYKEGTIADGQLQCTIKDDGTILAQETIDYTDINTNIPETYAHGYISFYFESLSLRVPETEEQKEYTLEFEMINHTEDTNNFIAASRAWEDPAQTVYGSTDGSGGPLNSFIAPFGIEIYEYRR